MDLSRPCPPLNIPLGWSRMLWGDGKTPEGLTLLHCLEQRLRDDGYCPQKMMNTVPVYLRKHLAIPIMGPEAP